MVMNFPRLPWSKWAREGARCLTNERGLTGFQALASAFARWLFAAAAD
jgi:hypothetical protein